MPPQAAFFESAAAAVPPLAAPPPRRRPKSITPCRATRRRCRTSSSAVSSPQPHVQAIAKASADSRDRASPRRWYSSPERPLKTAQGRRRCRASIQEAGSASASSPPSTASSRALCESSTAPESHPVRPATGAAAAAAARWSKGSAGPHESYGSMSAYAELQEAEFGAEKPGYRATTHQKFVGTGYFDLVSQVISEGTSSVGRPEFLVLHDGPLGQAGRIRPCRPHRFRRTPSATSPAHQRVSVIPELPPCV
ncbi:Bifunctional glyoxylate cycle protein [Tetrabaena socialis]|uniref:Bifunctional glyoxylate cycle protein n=1 Tax=Tetrabaena socialis TaxID=47790 RepID=A0A2J7ZMD7_9CHLO|nr:Bifunctional glyoxylate cycle protein [Tetrabaena socialis]|eukprot:PNH01425.1 Bifunctional glyoxylate cycle protein [Tetrabaena socialis]